MLDRFLSLSGKCVIVTFVTPPSDFLLDQRVFVSLGILKVAAVVRAAGFEVEHLDLTGEANYVALVEQYPRADRTFCITATTPQVPAACRIAAALKGSRTVLGGPHATLVNAAARTGNERAMLALAKLMEIFTCVVAGDGERAIWRALWSGARLVDADDPKSELWQSSHDFTDSPWPARDLVDLRSYRYEVDGVAATSMITQLGCPFECGFCGGRMSPMLRRIRTRPSTSVIAEMMHLHDTYGYRGLMFYDDELNVNRQMVNLMHDIANTGVDWRLRGFVKAELFTREQADSMYRAGFRWLLCGFESAHPQILLNINKKATLADNTAMVRCAHEAGLKVKALMSFGHPGESHDTIMATRDWLLAEKPDDFDATVITVYPGTPYYDRAVHVEGDIYRYEYAGDALYSRDVDFTQEQAYYKGVRGKYHSFVWTDHLGSDELVRLRDEVEDEVRTRLAIPYPQASTAAIEQSMGQQA